MATRNGKRATDLRLRPQAPWGASAGADAALGYLNSWLSSKVTGEVSERPKEHAWKVCIRKRIEGSNPSLSATCFQFVVKKQ